MLLYHISTNSFEPIKHFVPRVPECAKEAYEDYVTPRICFATSIEGALTACPCAILDISLESFKLNPHIMVYTLDTSILTKPLVPPKDLYYNHNVVDALYTGEHWVTEPITLKGQKYRINSFEIGRAVLLDHTITKSDLLNILKSNHLSPPTYSQVNHLLQEMEPIELINFLDYEDSIGELTSDMVAEALHYSSLMTVDILNGHFISDNTPTNNTSVDNTSTDNTSAGNTSALLIHNFPTT